jgi:hypothetical protein
MLTTSLSILFLIGIGSHVHSLVGVVQSLKRLGPRRGTSEAVADSEKAGVRVLVSRAGFHHPHRYLITPHD